jgi:hypothetical protein
MCYMVNSNTSNFTIAESFCNRRGGNLAKFDTGGQQLLVRPHCRAHGAWAHGRHSQAPDELQVLRMAPQLLAVAPRNLHLHAPALR